MDKFTNLPSDKQQRIIDAALQVFGSYSYKKASVGDIASAAGISKGMVFHYFGSKRTLYFYLINMCGKLLTTEREKHLDKTVTDFFDRIKMATLIKIAAMKKYPYILGFLKNVYSETDPEVAEEINTTASTGKKNSWEALLVGIDTSKFKNPAAPELLAKMIVWAGEGAMDERNDIQDIDKRMEEYIACLDLLKENFYS